MQFVKNLTCTLIVKLLNYRNMAKAKICTCIADVTKKVTDHVKKELDKNNEAVSLVNDGELGHAALIFSSPMAIKLHSIHELRYTFQKRDGSRSTEKVKKTNVMFSFCPFCGVPYDDSNKKTIQK